VGLIHISETQLAFGYFHSYMNVNRPSRFILPSIRQEGGRVRFPFPGADIVIENNWLIQFKRPFYFTTAGIKEFWNYDRPSNFDPPFFRFHIKNDSPTNQLNNLIAATKRGFAATYISPLFTDDTAFHTLMRNDALHLQSYAHIDIAQFDGMQRTIGNNNDHTILYNDQSVTNGICYCFSEPKLFKASKSFSQENTIEKSDYRTLEDSINFIIKTFFNNEFPYREFPRFYFPRYLQERLLIEHNILWVLKWRHR
jgi:hypothetical protein